MREPAVFTAARAGDLPALRWVLDEDPAAATARGWMGETPLHCAVRSGDVEMVALLLAAGADASVCDNGGSSPAHLARARGLALDAPLTEPMDPGTVVASAQSALRVSGAGRTAFDVAGHATLVRWGLDKMWPEVIVATEHAAIGDLAVHPSRPLVAVAPTEGPVELRGDDFANPQLIHELCDITALAFSPDGRLLAAAGGLERIMLFDLQTRRITADAEAGERNGSVAFSPDGTLLATTCSFQTGAHVRVDRVTDDGALEPLARIERAARDTIPAAVFAPDGRYLVIWETSGIIDKRDTSGYRGDLLLTDTDGFVVWQRRVEVDGGPQYWITTPCLSRDGASIALGLDGVLLRFRTNDGTPLPSRRIDGNAIAVATAGRRLIVATDRSLLSIKAS
ncbi:WD40 repeat domain-containing protein [Actinoplanes sp. L3-i22]|uniref:WD40 repeat domain-containing protein n=1 Tax=Actinoplanes sp. L3-i22 TaxID=2836373 RepID=UPI001C7510AF|nr:ankyrin repeat domain-containing protein [Actinoplanes sp. L3-i22]BCY08698.1 hypothetical protein L3i22_037860 [Actinoplanes sp. L3-i22]